MIYELVGTNGATISIGDERVKASSVHRDMTRTNLEKRLGKFQARERTTVVIARDPALDRFPEAVRADEYRQRCEDWRRWQEGKRLERSERSAVGGGATNGMDQASDAVGDAVPKPIEPEPNLESFYYAQGEDVFAERWRNRNQVKPLPALRGRKIGSGELLREIDGFHPYPSADGVRYATGPRASTAFLDRGSQIEVVLQTDKALLASLRLAAIKFDRSVLVDGDDAFRNRVYAIAETNGLTGIFTNPDLVARHEAATPAPPPLAPVLKPDHNKIPAPKFEPLEIRVAVSPKSNDARNRTIVHEPRRPGDRRFMPIEGWADLRPSSEIGVDERTHRPSSVPPPVSQPDAREGPDHHDVRSAESSAPKADFPERVRGIGHEPDSGIEADPTKPQDNEPIVSERPRRSIFDIAKTLGPSDVRVNQKVL